MVPGTGSNAMTTRVTTVEGSVARLTEKIERQHSRLEGLLRELLGTPVVKSNPAVQLIPEPPTALPETSMAAAVRVALASEPCPRVSFKDDDDVIAPRSEAVITHNVSPAANGANNNVTGEDTMDAAPMDVEGVTDSVENVVISIGGAQVSDDQVQSEVDAYDMVDVAVTEAQAAKLSHEDDKVCSTFFFY